MVVFDIQPLLNPCKKMVSSESIGVYVLSAVAVLAVVGVFLAVTSSNSPTGALFGVGKESDDLKFRLDFETSGSKQISADKLLELLNKGSAEIVECRLSMPSPKNAKRKEGAVLEWKRQPSETQAIVEAAIKST